MRRVALLLLALSLTVSVNAQSGSFEIASVKPSTPDSTAPAGMVVPALGRLTATNATLRRLVYAAYQLQPFQVAGGPAWQNINRFDISARTVDASATTQQILEQLKTLLADRFKLKVHTETREIPIFALVVARDDGRLGAKLKPSAAGCPDFEEQRKQQFEALAKGGSSTSCAITLRPSTSAPGSIAIQATGQTLRSLAEALTSLVGRQVVDKTGLTSTYDFDLTVDLQTLARLASDFGGSAPQVVAASPDAPALMTQLQEDLGLKLDSQRGPGTVLVIDSAELPTPDWPSLNDGGLHSARCRCVSGTLPEEQVSHSNQLTRVSRRSPSRDSGELSGFIPFVGSEVVANRLLDLRCQLILRASITPEWSEDDL